MQSSFLKRISAISVQSDRLESWRCLAFLKRQLHFTVFGKSRSLHFPRYASLDENKIVGATLTDLSKAFNCLPHDLLVAKLEAYGLDTKTLKLMLSYVSGRKQCVKITNSFSLLKLILFDIPHGSILEPIFFNIFMNDIFFLLGSDLHNFADDNSVTAVAENIQDLINSLEVKTSNIIELMKDNDMIANPNKFKAIVLTKTDHNTAGIRPNSYVVLLSCRTK